VPAWVCPSSPKFISFFTCGADIGPLDTWRHNEAILPIPSILVIPGNLRLCGQTIDYEP